MLQILIGDLTFLSIKLSVKNVVVMHVVIAVNEVIRYVIDTLSHIVTLVYTISTIVDMVDTILIGFVLITIDGAILCSTSPHGTVHLIDMERQGAILVIF